jgi:hypothetical protein
VSKQTKQAKKMAQEAADKIQEGTDQVMNKAHEALDGKSRGMGIFALIAILTIVGIAVWIILANNQES